MNAPGFTLFSTPIGHCALAWGGHGLLGISLPAATETLTRNRLARAFSLAHEAPPPADVEHAMARIVALLSGMPDDLAIWPSTSPACRNSIAVCMRSPAAYCRAPR